MQFKYLKTRQENETLWAEIVNPPLNFLTADILAELFDLVRNVEKDDTIRVFVLTGGIDDTYIMHFSIPELRQIIPDNRRMLLNVAVRFRLTRLLVKLYLDGNAWLMDRSRWYERWQLRQARLLRGYASVMFLWMQMMRTYHAIERLNKVTIAAVNGPCNGGGTELSMCFDFRFMIAGRGFTIGQPESLIGIIPGGGGTQRLPRLVGRAKALEMMLTGKQLTPEEAKTIGLITDCFGKEDFPDKVQAFADAMSRRPPVAVAAIKQAVLCGLDTTPGRGMNIEMIQSVRCFDTRDAEMAMAAYSAYLDRQVNLPPDKRPAPEEIVDTLQNARIFEKFQGR
ncbi:MAG: enoyl-CoA hydratase/isomerase family protein [Thermodesulfobacteriota bacterium]